MLKSIPLSNVNSEFVNKDNSHYSALFTDTTRPQSVNPNVLPEPINNIQAAKGEISLNFRGGKRKNITNMYRRMRNRRTRIRSKTRSKNRSRTHNRSRSNRSRSNRRRRTLKGGQKGGMPNYPLGYSQYQNNMPMTQTYSLGGKLTANESALANPPPVKVLSNCTNCVDNYSKYTNSGFPSRGWW
jgi:nucleosome binding factor SPN SPT16 subunit